MGEWGCGEDWGVDAFDGVVDDGDALIFFDPCRVMRPQEFLSSDIDICPTLRLSGSPSGPPVTYHIAHKSSYVLISFFIKTCDAAATSGGLTSTQHPATSGISVTRKQSHAAIKSATRLFMSSTCAERSEKEPGIKESACSPFLDVGEVLENVAFQAAENREAGTRSQRDGEFSCRAVVTAGSCHTFSKRGARAAICASCEENGEQTI